MDLFGYFPDSIKSENNQQGSYSQGQVQSPNPQTPSSIPEIILTGIMYVFLNVEPHSGKSLFSITIYLYFSTTTFFVVVC